jgi:AbrB family looped-hinge helix DNA binding protein
VIPAEIRARHGIRPGDVVQIVDYAGQIAILPMLEDPIQRGRGMFKGGPSLTKSLREERERDREAEERELQTRG